uniref:Interleukin-33 n=1 Tax=Moschus moschiferus TaxID=68415 RepID=A0A8C6D8X2_MOSMO
MLFTSLLFTAICKASSDSHFSFLQFLFHGDGLDPYLLYNVTNLDCIQLLHFAKRHSSTAEKYKEHQALVNCEQPKHFGRSVDQGFTLGKTIVRKYTTATGLPSIKGHSASLSTYNDQFITFVFADGSCEIYVDDLIKDQEKDKVLLRYYDFQFPSSETDGNGNHRKLMVNLSPTKDKDFLLPANSKEHSVELQKCEKQLPEQAFFVLHEKSSQCVSFECKSNPGVFLGVKDNQLALIKRGEHPEDSNIQNITFKLSNLM